MTSPKSYIIYIEPSYLAITKPHTKMGKLNDSLQCDNLIVVTLLLVKEQLFIKLMYLHCRLQILLLPRNSTNLKRKNLMNSKW